MYSVLLFGFGKLQSTCGAFWPEHFNSWGSIFLADFLRGYIEPEEFIHYMALINSDYIELAECIVSKTS